EERQALAKRFYGHIEHVLGSFKDSGPRWSETFSAAEINGFFEEFFSSADDAEVLRKQNISDLRVAMENGVLRLGFRYGWDPWSTVVSYDLKIWLARNEVNVVAVELMGRRAGALPILSESLLADISELGQKKLNIDVTWYRYEGNPVALIRWQR